MVPIHEQCTGPWVGDEGIDEFCHGTDHNRIAFYHATH